MRYALLVIVLMAGCANPTAPSAHNRFDQDGGTKQPPDHLICGRSDLTPYPSGWAVTDDGTLVYRLSDCALAATIPPCYFWADEGLLACP